MNYLQSYLYSMFLSAFVCSMLLFFHGNTASKGGLETGCACVMLIVFLSPLTTHNLTDTFIEWTSSPISEGVNSNVQSSADLYTKQVMEQEYSAYIFSKAKEFGIALTDVSIEMEKNENGHWVPYSIEYDGKSAIDKAFLEQIETDLGVPKKRQNTYEITVTY